MSEKKETGGDRLQELVREMQELPDVKAWCKFLSKKAESHRKYYHYTTLSVLRKIIGSTDSESRWKIPFNESSNDKTEISGFSVSFTTSIISNVGMWKVYSPLPENGVIIEFPHKIWKEVFLDSPKSSKKELSLKKITPTDVAYYHIGKSGTGKGNLFYWRDIQLPENSMVWKFSQEAKGLHKPCFKKDVWRFERETRVFYEPVKDFRESLIFSISPAQLQELKFHLSPMFMFAPGKLFRKDDFPAIVEQILPKQNKIKPSQFIFPDEDYGISFKKGQEEEDILKEIRTSFTEKYACRKSGESK